MKKTYINPQIEVVKFQTNTGILAGSELNKYSGNVTDEKDVLGREFDFGEDDEY